MPRKSSATRSGAPAGLRSSTSAKSKSSQRPKAAKTALAKAQKGAPKTTAATLTERMAEARKLEALDAAIPGAEKGTKTRAKVAESAKASHPLRNSDFPRTYITKIAVSLDDPDHFVTLTWAGPKAPGQETGPFRGSPGAGVKGLNCDNVTTSRRSGSKCTPKGAFSVEGFASRLNSDSRAVFVTWFVRRRGIALHYFPVVPRYAGSHGCVRLETKHAAQLIQDNSKIGDSKVEVSGTWTKPAKQW